MMGHEMGSHTGCMSHCGCGCGGMMSIEEEIQALEVHRQHLKELCKNKLHNYYYLAHK